MISLRKTSGTKTHNQRNAGNIVSFGRCRRRLHVMLSTVAAAASSCDPRVKRMNWDHNNSKKPCFNLHAVWGSNGFEYVSGCSVTSCGRKTKYGSCLRHHSSRPSQSGIAIQERQRRQRELFLFLLYPRFRAKKRTTTRRSVAVAYSSFEYDTALSSTGRAAASCSRNQHTQDATTTTTTTTRVTTTSAAKVQFHCWTTWFCFLNNICY